ncbi:hypothetical protein EON79_18135 [bacterium]|nr:MAG: hypothetical protein EON79_18135 [bacterium]
MGKRPFAIIVGLFTLGLTLPASARQYAEMDFQFVAPVLSTKYLTGRFVKATPNEIVAWLGNQNVDVTVDPSLVGKMKPVTVSFTAQPIDKAMKLLGDAMGGTFIERSDTWIFKPMRLAKKANKGKVGARSSAKALCAPAHRAPIKY